MCEPTADAGYTLDGKVHFIVPERKVLGQTSYQLTRTVNGVLVKFWLDAALTDRCDHDANGDWSPTAGLRTDGIVLSQKRRVALAIECAALFLSPPPPE